MIKQKIDITPSWKKLDAKGLQNAFEMIREMGSKFNLANNELKKLAKEKE